MRAPKRWTDDFISGLPYATKDQREIVYRDPELPRLMLICKRHRKVWTLQAERPAKFGERKTLVVTIGIAPMMKLATARARATAILADIAEGKDVNAARRPGGGQTFADAWTEYAALMRKNNRSAGTIADYKDKFERHLKPFHGRPLRSITRAEAIALHNEITQGGHPYAANGVMRVAHAIYNYAAKDLEWPGLPALNPFRGRNLLNEERPRQSGMGTADLAKWFEQLQGLSPVMRELHWMALLTGLRRNELTGMRWSHVHVREGYVEIPAPKGGAKRAFRAPLSRAMLRSLWRVRRAGRVLCEVQAKTWVFPSDRSASGHIEEVKGQSQSRNKDGSISRFNRIDKVGHALRHSFKTLSAASGMQELYARMLMNHQIATDVHNAYMNTPKLFNELRAAQEELSRFIIRHAAPGAAGLM